VQGKQQPVESGSRKVSAGQCSQAELKKQKGQAAACPFYNIPKKTLSFPLVLL
jgi:hypothetical protein